MAAVKLVKNSIKKLICMNQLNFIALPKNQNQNRISESNHLIFAIRSRCPLHLNEDSSPDIRGQLRIILRTLILFSNSSWSLVPVSIWVRIVGIQNEKKQHCKREVQWSFVSSITSSYSSGITQGAIIQTGEIVWRYHPTGPRSQGSGRIARCSTTHPKETTQSTDGSLPLNSEHA
jgi:hypothetical protein